MLAAVRSGLSDIEAMVKVMYADVREELHKAAGRSVLSHLIKLVDDGRHRRRQRQGCEVSAQLNSWVRRSREFGEPNDS